VPNRAVAMGCSRGGVCQSAVLTFARLRALRANSEVLRMSAVNERTDGIRVNARAALVLLDTACRRYRCSPDTPSRRPETLRATAALEGAARSLP